MSIETDKKVFLLSFIPVEYHNDILAGTSTYDASANFSDAINAAISTDASLILPEGQITYSSLPNIKTSGFKVIGQGASKTKLNYTGLGIALSFNAFESGNSTDPFINGLSIGGFHIVGDNFQTGLFAQGVARSSFYDIMCNGSNGLDGTTAFRIAGCMLNTFNNLKTSYPYGTTPYRGIHLVAGSRVGISVGGCSNNIFLACYAEGNSIGWQISSNGGDQNTFIGGSPEACKIYGLLIGSNCRYNNFIGVGFENASATAQDVNDAGTYTRYTTCYSAKHFLISSTAKGIRVENGYFERLEIQANSRANIIDQVTVNNWNTGTGGFIDNGFDTTAKRIIDGQTGEFIHIVKARFSVSVGVTPFLWANPYEYPVKIRIQGGTVSQILVKRGADFWVEPNPVVAGGGAGTVGIYMLSPGDSIQISYSVVPLMSVIPISN